MPYEEFDGPVDYTSELDDAVDKIRFGKYRGRTPQQVLQDDPGYIVWAWNNTIAWVGSQDLANLAAYDCQTMLQPRPYDKPLEVRKKSWPSVEVFESAMLEAFGEFPLSVNLIWKYRAIP